MQQGRHLLGLRVPLRLLAMTNQIMDDCRAEREVSVDTDTHLAAAWFEESGFGEGEFTHAEALSRAKRTSGTGLPETCLLEAGADAVRFVQPSDVSLEWNLNRDSGLTTWKTIQYPVRLLEEDGVEAEADLLSRCGSVVRSVRQLACNRYSVAERRKEAAEELQYLRSAGT